MIAIRVHAFGGPNQIQVEETPIPELGPGQALVRVHAASVGPWDALIRSGESGLGQSLPLTPGSDIAGIVERAPVQEGAAAISAGQAIYGVTNALFTGGYAQYAVADLRSIAPKPEALSFVEAASVPVIAVTALKMLFSHAAVVAGQSVLVLGGAGNVGAYAVQLASWADARVTAVGSGDDAGYMKSIGAASTIDYRTQRLAGSIEAVDVVIDTVGGDAQTDAFAVVKPGGVLVSCVAQPAEDEARRRGVRAEFFIVDVRREDLERITELIDDGVIKTDVGIILPLTEARKAHEMLAGSVEHPRGKIVLDTMPQEG